MTLPNKEDINHACYTQSPYQHIPEPTDPPIVWIEVLSTIRPLHMDHIHIIQLHHIQFASYGK